MKKIACLIFVTLSNSIGICKTPPCNKPSTFASYSSDKTERTSNTQKTKQNIQQPGGFMGWYIKKYKDTVTKDTSFLINDKDKINLRVKYYCTFDNRIILKGDLLKMYDTKGHLVKAPDKFITHNFVATVTVSFNSKNIFKGIIKKEDFTSQGLDDDLKQAGVLDYQGVSKFRHGFSINFRIGIPTNEYRGDVCTLDFDSVGKWNLKLH